MKKTVTSLMMGLLLSTPHTTEPKTLRTMLTLGVISIPGFHSYRAYKKASEENKKQPELYALVALQEFTANALQKSAFLLTQTALYIKSKSETTKKELEEANQKSVIQESPKSNPTETNNPTIPVITEPQKTEPK